MSASTLLVICAASCMALISCEAERKNAGVTMASGVTASQVPAGKSTLSRGRIIEIADAEARRRGCYPDQWIGIYDEGNTHWKSMWAQIEAQRTEVEAARTRLKLDIKPQPPVHVPDFEGRDYQVVIYRRREILPSGDLVIVVDRSSGEVIRVIQGG